MVKKMSDTKNPNQAPGEVGQISKEEWETTYREERKNALRKEQRKNDWNADPARLQSIKEHDEPKSIGIVGSRRRKSKADYHQLHAAVMGIYNDGDAFVSGGCPQGGDFFAEGIAKRAGATITIHHPNW